MEKKVWELGYLKGTPAEIRHILYKEVERLVRERTDAAEKCEKYKRDLLTAEHSALQRGDIASLQDQLQQAIVETQSAKDVNDQAHSEDNTTAQRLTTSANYNRLKQKQEKTESDLNKMKKAVISKDPTAVMLHTAIGESLKNLEGFGSAIGNAEKWKREVLDALENSKTLRWPVTEGDIGTIRTITPITINSDGFAAKYEALEFLDPVSNREGIVTFHVRSHIVTVFADLPKMTAGKQVNLDAVAFEVIKIDFDPDLGTVCVLRKSNGDLAKLLSAINTSEANIERVELDALVRKLDVEHVPPQVHAK